MATKRAQPDRLVILVGAVVAVNLVLAIVAGVLLTRPAAPRADGETGQAVPAASAVPAETPTTAPTSAPAPSAAPRSAAAVGSAVPVSGAPAPSVAASASASAPASAAAPASARTGVLAPMPLVGVGKPAFASAGVATPGVVNDGKYCGKSVWRATAFPSWAAIKVGAGPQRLLLSWNGADPDDYLAEGDAAGSGVPTAYTIETSADSTDGADGTWQPVARVRDNTARTRAHSFPFAGASWVRLTVTAGGGGALAIDEIDLHDSSAGSADSVFFLGDSITAAAFLRCDQLQPSFATLVHSAAGGYTPAMIDGGVSGVSSDYGVDHVDRLIADNPDFALWAVAYGTNDAYRERPSEVFEGQLQAIIDRLRAADKQVVLAKIPYTANAAKDVHVRRLNGVIDRLRERNSLPPGPDLYAWFRDHPQELAADGIHPTPTGSLSINRLWFEALRWRYGLTALAPPPAPYLLLAPPPAAPVQQRRARRTVVGAGAPRGFPTRPVSAPPGITIATRHWTDRTRRAA